MGYQFGDKMIWDLVRRPFWAMIYKGLRKAVVRTMGFLVVGVISLSYLSPVYANVVGVDTQNFNPTTNGLDFVTVHSSQVLDPGIFNLGLFLNFAVNSLPQYEFEGSRTKLSDTLLSSDLNFGVGLMSNWDVGISFPAVLHQNVSSNLEGARTEFAQTGLTEIRANTKYRLWKSSDDVWGLAGVLSTNLNRIRNNPFLGQGGGPIVNLEIALDRRLANGWVLGLNAGRRWRKAGDQIPEVPIEPLPDQWLASLAGSYLFADYDSKLILELFGAVPAESHSQSTSKELSTAEFLVGIKRDLRHDVAIHYGGGAQILKGTASADWRLYLGINWAMGPFWGRPSGGAPPADQVSSARRATYEPAREIGPGVDNPFVGRPQSARESFVARDILFAFNSEDVDPRIIAYLEQMLSYLQQGEGFKSLIIEGHTDSVGNPDYNLALSLRRAQNVRDVMIRLGGDPERIRAVGKGESEPMADNSNYQGRARNRRVEFKVQW